MTNAVKPSSLPISFAKPTGLIEIREPDGDGKLTLADRQLLNHLLAAAAPNIATQEVHAVHLAEIRRFAADARGVVPEVDNRRLKQSIRRLQDTKVEYNYLSSDNGRVWGSSALLPEVEIHEDTGRLEYSFAKNVREYLSEPALFSVISLRIQYQFDSKYGLVLYEVLRRYADRRANDPWWEVDVPKLRSLLGCENKLTEWKDLRKRALDPAIDEINRLSGFIVGLEEVRHGRGGKVVGARFRIEQKDAFAAAEALREMDKPRVQRRGERKARKEDEAVGQAIAWLQGQDSSTRLRWSRRAESLGVTLPKAAIAIENLIEWVPSIATVLVEEENVHRAGGGQGEASADP